VAIGNWQLATGNGNGNGNGNDENKQDVEITRNEWCRR